MSKTEKASTIPGCGDPGFRRTDCSVPEREAAAARQVDSGYTASQGDALHASSGDPAAAPGNWPRAVWRLVQRRQSGGRLFHRLGAGGTGVVVVGAMLMAGRGPSRPGAMAMLTVTVHA